MSIFRHVIGRVLRTRPTVSVVDRKEVLDIEDEGTVERGTISIPHEVSRIISNANSIH